MQGERLLARQRRGAGLLRLGDRGVEQGRAGRERPAERLLLGVGHGRDAVEVGGQLGIARAHRIAGHRQQLGQRRVLDAEQLHRADGAAQQPAEDVAATLVAGSDAVTDQHQAAAHVVGDDAQPDVGLVVGPVADPGEFGRAVQDRGDLVDLVHVVDALQQEGHPLQAHAGVDVLLRQLAEDAELLLAAHLVDLVLHEHEVPDLEEPVTGEVDRRAAVRAELRPAVDVDLRAGPGRSGGAGVPVVVLLAQALDPLLRQPGDAVPGVGGLVVVQVDGGPDLVRVEGQPAVLQLSGDQLPGVLDRAFLEVVTEGEVAVHLEERAVPRGLADLLDVEGADALLHAGRPRIGRRLPAGQVRDERHHAGDGEQQRRVR